MADVPAGAVWGVLGTANIAARAFLPALREAGGRAAVVGSRSADRGADWAAANEVGRADSYAGVLEDPEVQAVYIALPNDQHAEWAAKAVAAGKVVLCEKPMAMDAAQAQALLSGVGPGALLWESFVFPFHPQTALVLDLVGGGRIGTLREMISEFHFEVGQPGNIRLQAERGGGALYDVGCYPVRLARLLCGTEPVAVSSAVSSDGGPVELDMAAIIDFPENFRVILSAGLRRPPSTVTRIIGSAGELRISNPFHPRPSDTVELLVDGKNVQSWPATTGSAFRYAIEHIHAVMAGSSEPRHLAAEDALDQARVLDLIRSSFPA